MASRAVVPANLRPTSRKLASFTAPPPGHSTLTKHYQAFLPTPLESGRIELPTSPFVALTLVIFTEAPCCRRTIRSGAGPLEVVDHHSWPGEEPKFSRR